MSNNDVNLPEIEDEDLVTYGIIESVEEGKGVIFEPGDEKPVAFEIIEGETPELQVGQLIKFQKNKLTDQHSAASDIELV